MKTTAVIRDDRSLSALWLSPTYGINSYPGVHRIIPIHVYNISDHSPGSFPQMQCVCHTWDWSPSLALSPCLLAWRTPPWFSPSIADTQPGVSWDCSGQHNAPCSSTPAQTVTCHTVFWMYNKGGWPQSTCTPTHYICGHIANLLIREATEWSGTLQEYYRHSVSPSSSHSSGIMLLLVNLIMKYMKYIGCSIVYNWGFLRF